MARRSPVLDLPVLLFGAGVVFGLMGRGPEYLLTEWARRRSWSSERVDIAGVVGQVLQLGVTLCLGGAAVSLSPAVSVAAFLVLASLVVIVRRRQRRAGLAGTIGDTFGAIHYVLVMALVSFGVWTPAS